MAHANSRRGLARPALAGPWALAPALVTIGLLLAAALGYAVAQSLGAFRLDGPDDLSAGAYRDLLAGSAGTDDLWQSAGFTLWVSAAGTALAAGVAILLVAWLDRPRAGRGAVIRLLHLNLAIPHLVWAVALLLVVSQSGVVARVAAAAGLIDSPADFPALVGDRFGIGLILHVATKEVPFLVLIGLALLRSQPRELGVIADTLGARGARRVRLYVLPAIAPGIAVGSALVFAFVFGSYEAPVVLGATSPRMLSVVGLDLFSSPDLSLRPAAMALGVLMTGVVAVLAAGFAFAWGKRHR